MDLRLKAVNLAFDQQLRIALPPAWRKTWATLNPSGASDVDAQIEVRPGKRHDYFVIKPRPDTRVQLLLPALPNASGAPGQPIRLPAMEDVRGTFVFNDGSVAMHGVGFEFRGAPVRVETGQVRVEDTGAFDLTAQDLMMTDFRLDAGLRKLMSPLMAQYARRLNDETIALVKGNLRINWSGRSNELAQVGWNQGLMVFNGNSIQAGMPLEHLQGQIDNLKGWFNGRDVEMTGSINLDSLSFQGLQFVKVQSPLYIGKGQAGLSDITAGLLGGQLKGRIDSTMDATPKYSLQFALADADLEQLAMTMPGRQRLKGRLSGQIVGNGLGQDRRSLQGQGWARVQQGDLGELPAFLSLIKFLKLSAPVNKTAFDSAQTAFRIKNGAVLMDTLKFEGDAFSLEGVGKVDAMDNLDMRLQLLLGRDGQFRLPIVSDLLREAGGQILVVRVQGTTQSPRFGLDPLPQAADIVKSLMNNK